MKRREFIERVVLVGGLALLQPWQIMRLLGVDSLSKMGNIIEDWDIASEAGVLPKNNVQSYGIKLIDSNLGISGVTSQGVAFGDATWLLEEDTQIVYVGGEQKSYKLTVQTAGSVISAYDIQFTINRSLIDIGKLLLPVYPTLVGPSYLLAITIGQEAALTNSYEYSASYPNEEGWFDNIRLRNEPTTTNGAPSFSNTFVRVRIRVQVAAGATGSVRFGSLYLNPQTTTRIAIGFDDRNISEYSNVFQYMRERNIPGFSCAISAFGSLTVAQMQEMVGYRWSIHNHTRNHPHLPTLSEQEILDEIGVCKNFLSGNLLHESGKDVFVYPYNDRSIETDQIISQLYPMMTGAAGTNSGIWGFRGSMMRDQTPTYLLRRVGMDNPTVPSTVIAFINRWIAQGVDGIIVGHNPTNGAQNGHTEVANLKTIVDVLHRYRQAGVIRVVNMNEMIVGLQRSRLLRVSV